MLLWRMVQHNVNQCTTVTHCETEFQTLERCYMVTLYQWILYIDTRRYLEKKHVYFKFEK